MCPSSPSTRFPPYPRLACGHTPAHYVPAGAVRLPAVNIARMCGDTVCERVVRARVLIGGLGMGYSVRTALDTLGEDARVVVAELVPAVVEWNRGVLADLAGRPLDDRRTELHEADVVQLITAARGDYDAIMLDVDNGAEAMVRKSNNWLYSLPGLTATYAALRRGGVLAIWSAGSQPPFVRRLRRAGFEVDEVKVRARGGSSRKGGAHHVVWIATRG